MVVDNVVEVIVSPFLGVLFDNLASLISKEVGLIWGVDKEIKKLSNTLSTIQDVLQDAEEKQLTEKPITNWLRKLKDVAYDADDVLDDWATEVMQLKSDMRCRSFSKQVFGAFLSCFQFKHIKLRSKIGKEIHQLRLRFDELAAERFKFHLREGVVGQRNEFFKNRETSSILTEPQVYGRDEEKDNIVELLVNNVSSREDVTTCSILGIGGLGKTTVAQLIYNEDKVKEHFEVRSWVCVSEDFDVKRLTKAILASISGNACDLEELDPLQRLLHDKFAGKRFLLVLDDVWNDNEDEWNKLKYSLGCGAKGSSIIVTTRLETVAAITSSFPPYRLKLLSEEDCWSLFKQRAFGMGNQEYPNLLKIGREIIKKCGGVPLAAKSLGGLLRFKSEENEWLIVRDSEIWDLPQSKENNILPALRLSYNHLPSYARQCFVFCSIFPKDHTMKKEDVIHLWMANGLIKSKERTSLEDIGSEIFNVLLWRSFFQDVEKNENGEIVWCKMHDLVHDLACSISTNECSNVEIISLPRRARHSSVILNRTLSSTNVDFICQSSPSLRTLLLLDPTGGECRWTMDVDFSGLISLRAMSLESMKIHVLPVSVGRLKHLRYLNLSFTGITSLPESISELRNLQTLKLTRCYMLQTLPKYMGNMNSLRHLDITECDRLTQMPNGIGQLSFLQTLSIFIVGSNVGCHIKELQKLDQLRGELTIKSLECVNNFVDAETANLIGKQHLHSLDLSWSHSQMQEEIDEYVIQGLKPHPNLLRLSIGEYQGLNFPSWLEASYLPNLVEIFLWSCRRWEHLPSLGNLPHLRKLFLHGISSVKFINDRGVAQKFSSLEELELHNMSQLEEWSLVKENAGGQAIQLPSLRKLSIKSCPKLRRLPLSLSLEDLVLWGCKEVLLKSVKSLPLLSALKIYDFNEHSSFPKGMLQNLIALQSLHIQFTKKLRSLPPELENLSKLTTLEVRDCEELLSLPEGLEKLSLKFITIAFCGNLNSFPTVGSSLI